MINLYVKFNMHSTYAKQVIVLKLADRRTDVWADGWTRLMTIIGIRQNFGRGLKTFLVSMVYTTIIQRFNPFEPEFTIIIFIHYKPRIAVAILDL